jgi:peptidoglycan/xylan/chitin deacetylase (PgdA/CDA1 family)
MVVSFTFDDGWKSQFYNARPILNKYGYRATFYIITISLYEQTDCYMDLAELRALSKEGHEIGAHSVTHLNLTVEGSEQILQSKLDLEGFGFDVKSFAYPYGAYNDELCKLVERSGFENARTAGDKPIDASKFERYAVNAFFVQRHFTIEMIKQCFETSNAELLILCLHQVEENCGQWGCTPEMLEQICEYVSSTGKKIEVYPISESIELYMKSIKNGRH